MSTVFVAVVDEDGNIDELMQGDAAVIALQGKTTVSVTTFDRRMDVTHKLSGGSVGVRAPGDTRPQRNPTPYINEL